MEKTINSIKYIPLYEMTEWDWRNLDWYYLRNSAKNKLAAYIVAGTLKGFYLINILMKGRAKPYYHEGAENDDPEEEVDIEDTGFGYTSDDPDISADVENVEQIILENSILPKEHLVRLLLAVLATANKVAIEEDKERIKDMLDYVEDYGRLNPWEDLLLAIYIFRWWGLPEWERQMEKIDKAVQKENQGF